MNHNRLAADRARAMRAGACGPAKCDDVPFAVRPVNPNAVSYLTPRNWWVVSGLNPDGTVRTPSAGLGVFASGFFEIDIAPNYALWALNVNYTSTDPLAVGMVQLGANNPPIRVLANVPFDLGTDKNFPRPLCGPLQVFIRGGQIAGDPVIALPVTWYAIIGELDDAR